MSEPRRTVANYLSMLQALLPRGAAWTRNPDATVTRTLEACAEELARVDAAGHSLVDEVNPLTTWNALDDWERVLGLPDACHPAGTSFPERRAAVLAKLRDVGRQDLKYWYELADSLGCSVTIEEHWPCICAWHECGDPRGGWTEESGMSEERWEQDVGYPLARCGPEEIRSWWNVIIHGDRLLVFRCGESLCPELLMDWRGADSLECLMHRDKHAHTLLTFDYREE